MSVVGVIGDRAAVDKYFGTAEGHRTARAVARAVFHDEGRLSDYEAALTDDLHPAVEQELSRLIRARNEREDPR